MQDDMDDITETNKRTQETLTTPRDQHWDSTTRSLGELWTKKYELSEYKNDMKDDKYEKHKEDENLTNDLGTPYRLTTSTDIKL
eukprot:1339779-Amphidinium_carterae.2